MLLNLNRRLRRTLRRFQREIDTVNESLHESTQFYRLGARGCRGEILDRFERVVAADAAEAIYRQRLTRLVGRQLQGLYRPTPRGIWANS